MVDLPPELWWRIAVFADAVCEVRCLRRDIRQLRPERSLLHRFWDDWVELPFSSRDLRQCYSSVGDLLLDVALEVEQRVYPLQFSRLRPVRRARCSGGWSLREPLQHAQNLTMRRVHEVYRIPGIVVRRPRPARPPPIAARI